MACDSTTVALMVGSSPSSGPVGAMARDVVAEWRLAAACGDFRDLAGGRHSIGRPGMRAGEA